MSPNENFQAGDTVELKSGGPIMTIGHIDGDGAWCTWFDGAKTAGQKFPLTSLRKKEPGRPSFGGA